MPLDFDQQEYIMEYKKQKEIYENLKRIDEKKEKTSLERSISADNNILFEKKEELKPINKIFKKRKDKFRIKELKDSISRLEKRIDENKEKIDKINKKYEKLISQKKNMTLSDAISFDKYGLIINDSEEIPLSANPVDDKVLVHCTDFFPKNKTILCDFDGNNVKKVELSIDGIEKKVETLIHRHTVHFTINSVVRTTIGTLLNGGDWKDKKYIIIEPLKGHEDQFVTDFSIRSDEYTYGSVKLSEKPILLIKEDIYNELSSEEKNNYNVIRYRGDRETCVDNLLHMLGYKLTYGDAENPHHKLSSEGILEDALDRRNIIINYVLDNKYDGKSDMSFSIEDIQKMYKVYNKEELKEKLAKLQLEEDIYNSFLYTNISKQTSIPIEFIQFCLNFGLYQDGDNYKIADDDKMYEMIKKYGKMENINENCDNLLKCELIKKIYDDCQAYIHKIDMQNNVMSKNKEEIQLLKEKRKLYSELKSSSELNNEENGITMSNSNGFLDIIFGSLITIIIGIIIFLIIK